MKKQKQKPRIGITERLTLSFTIRVYDLFGDAPDRLIGFTYSSEKPCYFKMRKSDVGLTEWFNKTLKDCYIKCAGEYPGFIRVSAVTMDIKFVDRVVTET